LLSRRTAQPGVMTMATYILR